MLAGTRARRSLAILALSLLTFAAGCSGEPAKARVKGKVTIGDKHLTVGNVMFYHEDGNTVRSGPIDKNGNYDIPDAPVGKVKVAVVVPALPPGGLGMMQKMKTNPGFKEGTKSVDPEDPSKSIAIMGDIPANVVPVPEKYSTAESSGLTYTVQRGEQTHDIKLAP